MSIKNNTTSLQSLLDAVNALPEAGGVAELPELTNEGTSDELFSGKELIDGEGNMVVGTFTIENELATQDDLLIRVRAALQNKGVGTTAKSFPNGTEWTQSNITSGINLPKQHDIIHANGIWMCVGRDIPKYSTDGKTWEQGTGFNPSGATLCFGKGIWVCGGYNGICYSTDGKTWVQSNVTGNSIFDIHYANGLFVAVGNASGYCVCYSTDGKTWTASNIKSNSTGHVLYAHGVWVAVGQNGGTYYSTDGKNWTASNYTSTYGLGIDCDERGTWVLANWTLTPGLHYSTNGKTWVASNITANADCAHYANGLWVAGVRDGGFYYSIDGKMWTQSNVTSGTPEDVYYADGIWISATTSGLYYSIDGKTWAPCTNSPVKPFAIYHANGIWTASSTEGIFYSVTWEQ